MKWHTFQLIERKLLIHAEIGIVEDIEDSVPRRLSVGVE